MYYTLVKNNEKLQMVHVDFYVNATGDILAENISLSEKALIQNALDTFYHKAHNLLTYIVKYQNKLYLALLCEHDECTKEYFKCSSMNELYIRYTLPAAKLLRTDTLFFKDTVILCGLTSGHERCNEIFTLLPLNVDFNIYNSIAIIMNKVCYYSPNHMNNLITVYDYSKNDNIEKDLHCWSNYTGELSYNNLSLTESDLPFPALYAYKNLFKEDYDIICHLMDCDYLGKMEYGIGLVLKFEKYYIETELGYSTKEIIPLIFDQVEKIAKHPKVLLSLTKIIVNLYGGNLDGGHQIILFFPFYTPKEQIKEISSLVKNLIKNENCIPIKQKDSSYLLDVGIILSEKEYEEFRNITSNNSDKMKIFLIKQILDGKADLLEVNKI